MKVWRKEKAFSIKNSGYHSYFGLSSSNLGNDDEFEVDEKQEALQASDYPMDQVGSSRMGWCEKCNKYDFYDKFTIHQQESKCHQARLMTCKSV